MTIARHFLPAVLSLAFVAVVAACADDFGRDFDSDPVQITFSSPQFLAADSVASRSGAGPELVDVIALESDDGCDSLCLEVYAEDIPSAVPETEVQSRGKLTSSWSSFGLFAYKYKAADGWNGEQRPNFAYNDQFTISGSTITPPKEYIWPGGKYKLRFYGVMPRDEGKPNASSAKGDPTLDFTVTTDVANQKDILVGSSGELAGNYYRPVEMKFTHPLASIQFVTDATPKYYSSGTSCGSFYRGSVNSMEITNVYSRGRYNLDKGEWTALSDKVSYNMEINKSYVGLSYEMDITPPGKAFFVIPQTAPDDAELCIDYQDYEGGFKRKLRASLAGVKWEPGKAYTYKVSTSSIKIDYVIEIDSTDCRPLDYYGGEIKLNVKSYKLVTRQGDPDKKVKIELESSKVTQKYNNRTWESASKVTIVQSATPSDDPFVNAYTATVTIPNMSNSYNRTDFKMTSRSYNSSTSSPYNLSNGGTGYAGKILNTANCYVVDGSGYVCFPVVFGPTFKDGVQRDYSFADDCAQDSLLLSAPVFPKKIIDSETGAVQTIMTPYDPEKTFIKDYLKGADTTYDWSKFTAKLDWVDLMVGGVSQVTLVNSGQYIRFYNSGVYCNAVISLYDQDNTRVWSWHIWSTDQFGSHSDVRVTANGYDFTMAAVDLGWKPLNETAYYDTEFKVQFKQKESGNTKEIVITKQSTTDVGLNGKSYSWKFGQMTPYTDSGTYGGSSKVITTAPLQRTLIGQLQFNIKDSWETLYSAFEPCFLNIWSWTNQGTAYTDDPVVKTLYDPCPVGYCMPPGLVFNAFGFEDKTGGQLISAESNPWVKPDPKYVNGYEFFANSEHSETIDLYYQGYYWTAQGSVSFNTPGKFWLYSSGAPYLQKKPNGVYRGSIRPIREQ